VAEPALAKSDSQERVVQVTKAVGDDLRCNILRVLAQDSFGVLELCAIFDMAQPALSHHLKILSNAALVAKRRESTHVFYYRVAERSDSLPHAIFASIDQCPLDPAFAKRIDKIYAERAERSAQFFASNAQALEQQDELICPSDVYAPLVVRAANAEAANRGQALEIGPGSGALMLHLAEHFDAVVGIDSSERMLAVTASKVSNRENVQLINRDFLKLPRTRRFDALVAAMVVHHMPSPRQFFAHAAAVMKPDGVLVVAELCTHAQEWVKDMCGDLWLGFDPTDLDGWAREAGFKPSQQQFLAQRNGFRVQIRTYTHQLTTSGTQHD
jgi:ArsR family transcriptional regulator